MIVGLWLLSACTGSHVEETDSAHSTPGLFEVSGSLAGEPVDFAIPSAEVWCERDYVVPVLHGVPRFERAALSEIRLVGVVDGGLMEMAFEASDFLDTPVGVPVVLGAGSPRAGLARFSWMWRTPDTLEPLAEWTSESGTLLVTRLTGEVAQGRVFEEASGQFAGAVAARWPGGDGFEAHFAIDCETTDLHLVPE